MKINFFLGIFTFARDDRDLKFNLVYDKTYKKSNKGKLDVFYKAGYEIVYGKRKYYLLISDKDIDIKPSYIDFYERQLKVRMVSGFVSGLCAILFFTDLLMNIVNFVLMMTSEDFYFWYRWIDLVASMTLLLLLAWSFPLWVSIVKSATALNKKMMSDNKSYAKAVIDSVNQNSQTSKKSKNYIRKLKPGWFLAPDRLENWLMKMEKKGFKAC